YEKLNVTLNWGTNLSLLGSCYQSMSNYPEAEKVNELSLELLTRIHNNPGICTTLMNLGATAFYQADYKTSLDYYMQALKIAEASKDERQTANLYINIGNVLNLQKQYDKAAEKYESAYKVHKKLGNEYGMAVCQLNIGEIKAMQKKYSEAETYFKESLNYGRKIDNKDLISLSLYNLGSTLGSMLKPEKSLEYYFEAIDVHKQNGNLQGVVQVMNDVGNVYRGMKNYAEAKHYLENALTEGLKLNAREEVKKSYDYLTDYYSDIGDYKKALEYHQKFTALKDSIMDEETSRQVNEMNAKYESEKKDHEIDLLNKSQALKDTEIKEQKAESDKRETQRNAVLIGFGLLLLLSIFIYRGYRQKQKDNRIIEAQKAEVEEKNKNITDSISYAKLIQEAILPAREVKYKLFPDAFVLFRPRDIVSGDFYWFAEKNGKKLIAAVDCTGHGVPGAFMSMIGNAFLNQVVNELGITEPGKILDELRGMIIHSLKQSGAEGENRDGMDISLLCFDENNTEVQFAGANNPLWYFSRNGFTEIKGDKQPIGYYKGDPQPFTTHTIPLGKGDRLYLFTDGYADQFGGEQGKKFKYRQLQETLLALGDMPMREQEEKVENSFLDWKKDLEQVDDVLVIGIRV
ncbi:MAG TPA: tetratricopeptide repeat protein, partial [Bacteroidia bacterium]